MAAKTFLTPQQTEDARKILEVFPSSPRPFSEWLIARLTERLEKHPDWASSGPIALGSWARGHLSPRSDIDMLFCGAESDVQKVVTDFNSEGLRLRYRVPADRDDWTVGVEAFDIVAYLRALPLTSEGQQETLKQVGTLKKRGRPFLRTLVKQMVAERSEREKRFDSISNFLEPNLKYGPGGLRDIDQALSIGELILWPSGISDESLKKARQILEEAQDFFLILRHKIQIEGGMDVLSAPLQKDLATWYATSESSRGDGSIRDFMLQVQRRLADVSFYADFIVARALANTKSIQALETMPIKRIGDAFDLLNWRSDILAQEKVRRSLESQALKAGKESAKTLTHYFNCDVQDKTVVAFFRSGLMAAVFPDLLRVKGLTQHDQYHRLTVEAHTLQAVREVLRVKRKPKTLGRLSNFVTQFDAHQWDVLLWSAFFHDLGKGLEGDHATKGAAIVKREMTRLGLSLRLTAQVAWMVQGHLLLSGAAFRQNPQSTSTWQWLFSQGVKGPRITLLSVFTAIDIRATNPEAWNEWKERLLFELAEALESPKASHLEKLLESAQKKKISLNKNFVEALDPAVLEAVKPQVLLDEYKALSKSKSDLELLVVSGRKKNEFWVRFHTRTDRQGLFLEYVDTLFKAGASVLEGFIHTYEEWGVYDWFHVKSGRTPAAFKKALLLTLEMKGAKVPSQDLTVKFESVDLVRSDDELAIFSFRGKDQKGALLAATRALYKAGLSIKWAKVHTWGHQIDDVFAVTKATSASIKPAEAWKSIAQSLISDLT